MSEIIQARFELTQDTTRVLDVIKGKYGLKNRNEALNKLIEEHKENYIEPQINEDYLKHLDNIVREHEVKYEKRSMTLEELDNLLEIEEE